MAVWQLFRSALAHNGPFNLDTAFVKEGNWPCVFSASNDESSRPVNACRFVLVFPCGGESQAQVGLEIVVKSVDGTLEYPV